MFQLLPAWLTPLIGWVYVSFCYYLTKHCISYELKPNKLMDLVESIIWFVSCIAICCFISYIIYAILTDNPDGNNPLDGKVEWLDILIPMLIPSLLSLYTTIKSHNSTIYK